MSFKVNPKVLGLKADVLDDLDSFLPISMRKKIGYTKPFDWNQFLKHISKPSVQSRIKACLPMSIPEPLVKTFRIYGFTNKVVLRKSIVKYLNDRYQTYSVFDADVRNFVTKWPGRWDALTDTSVRDEIRDIYTRQVEREPTSYRLVIGYYPQDPDFDPEDKRPAATKKTLEALLRKPKTWAEFHELFHEQPIYDKKGVHYPVRLGKIKPSHIKKIKVLSGPVHNPTFWEKLTGKHDGWIYHPALVAVVDVQNIPLVKVKKTPQKPMDGKFGDWVVAHHFHSARSGDGWINQFRTSSIKKKDPFHGDLYLLQMGELFVLPNYRHFVRESF